MGRSVQRSALVVAVCACMLGCTPSAKDPGLAVPPGGEVRKYEVFGMGCPGCHGGLTKLVEKLEGVAASRANWSKGELLVAVRPSAAVADADVHDAIRRANLTPGKRLR